VTPADIKAARIASGMTQTDAGASVGGTLRTWQDWESGKRAMPSAAWDLFLLVTDQHPTHRMIERGVPPTGASDGAPVLPHPR
jgi:DNA-binding transcriptional regulator YiaG